MQTASRFAEQESSERFLRQFARSRRRLDRITKAEISNAMRLVGEMRTEIRGILKFNQRRAARGEPPTFAARALPRMASDIESALDQWARASGQSIDKAFEGAFELGQTITASSLSAGGIEGVAFPSVSADLLRTASNNIDGILDEVGRGFSRRVQREVNLAAVGLQPSTQAIRRVEGMLRTGFQDVAGARRRIGFPFQAEQIVRTEVGRVFTTTQHSAGLEISSRIPNLRKRWLTVGGAKVRKGHRAAEKTYGIGGKVGPIPMRRRFAVTDHSRTGKSEFFTGRTGRGLQRAFRRKGGAFPRRGKKITDRMLHPLDPKGSPGNVIGCRCVVLEVVPGLDRQIRDAGGILREELA